MKSAKYFAAYLIPAIAIWSLFHHGLAAFAVVHVCFRTPAADRAGVAHRQETNLNGSRAQESYLADRFFDWLLYLNVPIVFGNGACCLSTSSITSRMSTATLVGHILIGRYRARCACGINVGTRVGAPQQARGAVPGQGLVAAFPLSALLHRAQSLPPQKCRYASRPGYGTARRNPVRVLVSFSYPVLPTRLAARKG
jgi:alkane 1-monooxygenase